MDKRFLANLHLQRTGPMLMHQEGRRAFSQCMQLSSIDPIVGWIDNYQDQHNQALQEIFRTARSDAELLSSQLVRFSEPPLSKLVSIGPGNAIVEAMLLSMISIEELILIDIEQTADIYHGFAEVGAGYADLGMSCEYLRAQGFSGPITTCNPTKSSLPTDIFDVCISVLSMGFHYPVHSYGDYLKECSRSGSLIIFDCRKGFGDQSFELISSFALLVDSIDHEKHSRCIFRVR